MASDRIRFLVVSPTLIDALLLVRVRTRKPPKPILDADTVERVEQALERELPDELLAYFAATGQDLGRIVALTDEARDEGLDPRLLAFARSSSAIWVAKARDAAVQVGPWDPSDPDTELDQSLAQFVRRHHDLHPPEHDEPQKIEKARQVFAPCVSRKAPERPSHVSHPKFGEGKVVSEIFDGNHKLVVDFPAGRKTVMARFVQVLDAAKAS